MKKVFLLEFKREKDYYVGSAVVTAKNADKAFELLKREYPDAESINRKDCIITELEQDKNKIHYYDSGYF